MIIKITKRENPFVMVDKSVIEDNRLSLKARGLLTYLLSRPPNWTICMSHLLKQFKEGKASIQAALGELKTYGYARLEAQQGLKGRISGCSWVIYEKPIELSTGSPVSRLSVKPAAGKSATNKKDSNKKDKTDRQTGNLPVCPSVSFEVMGGKIEAASTKLNQSFNPKECLSVPDLLADGPTTDDQALVILRRHPVKHDASKAIPDVKKAIAEYGYHAVLSATVTYAKEVLESGTEKPSWPSYWFREGHYKVYLPLPVEKACEPDYQDTVDWSRPIRVLQRVDLPTVSPEEIARQNKELEQYEKRLKEKATLN